MDDLSEALLQLILTETLQSSEKLHDRDDWKRFLNHIRKKKSWKKLSKSNKELISKMQCFNDYLNYLKEENILSF